MARRTKHVAVGMMNGAPIMTAGIDMPASCVAVPTSHQSATNHLPLNRRLASDCPRCLRGMLWDDTETPVTPLATQSETLHPLPRLLASELNNEQARHMLCENPDLFKVVTPINVNRFEAALKTHPNHSLVNSVVAGLHEGFWLFTDFEGLDMSDTWEEVYGVLSDEAASFTSAYVKEEEAAE